MACAADPRGLVRDGRAARTQAPRTVYSAVAPRRVMAGNRKQLIVVGDRVLIKPEEGDDRTRIGLYLPATAVDNQAVQTGTVVATGPGTPISAPTELGDEPWKMGSDGSGEPRYMPMQARIGDFAIFFRRAAVEITFEDHKYLVVPQAAILGLVRETPPEDIDW
jgi:co-chaperonin GroES (HSP10)